MNTDPAEIMAQFEREPLLLPWPADGKPGAFLRFESGASGATSSQGSASTRASLPSSRPSSIRRSACIYSAGSTSI